MTTLSLKYSGVWSCAISSLPRACAAAFEPSCMFLSFTSCYTLSVSTPQWRSGSRGLACSRKLTLRIVVSYEQGRRRAYVATAIRALGALHVRAGVERSKSKAALPCDVVTLVLYWTLAYSC